MNTFNTDGKNKEIPFENTKKLKEDLVFEAELQFSRIETLVKNKNYLTALENLFELDKEGLVKDKTEELLDTINRKGEFIENGLKGQYYYKNRDYEKSLELLQKYLKVNQIDRKALELVASLHEKLNNFKEAADYYEKLQKQTDELVYYRKASYCYFKLNNIKDAVRCLDAIIEKEPSNKDAIDFKKMCLRQYRTTGLKEPPKKVSSADDNENPILNKKNIKIAEIICLILLVIGFSVYFLGATDRALNGLKNDDNIVKLRSISALKGNNKEEVINGLVKTLNDKDPSIRSTSVRILGESGNSKVVEPLISLLKDKDWSVRKTTIEVLGTFKDQRAVLPIIEIINNDKENGSIRLMALNSLENIQAEKISPLVPVLLKDKDWKIRRFAIQFIEHFSMKTYKRELEKMIKEETDSKVSLQLAKTIKRLEEK